MKNDAIDSLLQPAGEAIAAQLGLVYPANRMMDLRRGLMRAAVKFGIDDLAHCIRWLLARPLTEEQVQVLASCLTVGETYFRRESWIFDAIEASLLPELIRVRRDEGHLRIWSAGCCSGEEPYSLAIALREQVCDLEDWRISILGTDINPAFIEKAQEALYGAWSFRNARDRFAERSFSGQSDGRWALNPEVRKMVEFRLLNLVSMGYPSPSSHTCDLDLILCCNVLIYFSPEEGRRVVRRLASCLRGGGWLVLGPHETMHAEACGLTPVRFGEATFFLKRSPDRERSFPGVDCRRDAFGGGSGDESGIPLRFSE